MNLVDGLRLARNEFTRLQAAYPVLADWRLRFGAARQTYGSCRFGAKQITVSRPLIESETCATEVLDTVRHEVAHALSGDRTHGPTWQAWAATLGAQPVARADRSTNPGPPPRYLLVYHCPIRGLLVAGEYHRRPRIPWQTYGIAGIPASFGNLKLISKP